MATGVEGRVGEHGDAMKHYAVKKGRACGVASPTALHWLAFAVLKKEGAVFVGAGNRGDRLVGADHGTHAAADAHFSCIGFLTYAGKGAIIVAAFLVKDVELRHPLAHMRQAD